MQSDHATKLDLAELRKEMKSDMAELRADLARDLAQHFTAALEEVRSWFRVGGDETRAVADKHDALRADFDRHQADPRLHRAPRK